MFDIGANVGDYTKLLAATFPDSHIYSFEPVKETFAILSKNIVENNVTLNNIGIGEAEGERTLYLDKANSGLASLYNRQLDYLGISLCRQEQVKLTTLDFYCEENQIEAIDFLKMDIEGSEYNALLGASNLLKGGKIKVIQIEMGGTNIDSRTYFRDFWNLLHKQFGVYRVLRDGIKEIRKYEEVLECFVTTNYLFIKK